MRMRAPLLTAGAAVGLALLALAGPSGEPRGGVVLNRDPPQAPRWGLRWEVGELPKPAGQAVGAPPCDYPGSAGDPPRTAADSGVEAGPVEDPYAG